MSRAQKGSNYDPNLKTSDIAKLIREFISTEKKEGDIPKGLKISVKTDTYSMGSSINARITAVPPSMDLHDEKSCHFVSSRSRQNLQCGLNSQIVKIFKNLKSLDSQYNYDNSDIQTDYFDVDHYFFTSVSHELSRVELDKMFDKVKDTAPVTGEMIRGSSYSVG